MRQRRLAVCALALTVVVIAASGAVALLRAEPTAQGTPREAATRRDVVVQTQPVARVHPSELRRYGTVADPLRIMVWGDSVAATFEPVVADALRRLRDRSGAAVLLRRAALGFGLTDPHPAIVAGQVTRPTFTDWSSQLAGTLRADRPDDVIVLIGTWDTLPRNVGGRWLAPGAAGWGAWYTRHVTDAATRITKTGAHVTWLTHPCVTNRERNANLPAVNAVYRRVAGRLPGVDIVDLDARVCPHGAFNPVARTPEGTHFAADASTALGPWFAKELARVWRLPTKL